MQPQRIVYAVKASIGQALCSPCSISFSRVAASPSQYSLVNRRRFQSSESQTERWLLHGSAELSTKLEGTRIGTLISLQLSSWASTCSGGSKPNWPHAKRLRLRKRDYKKVRKLSFLICPLCARFLDVIDAKDVLEASSGRPACTASLNCRLKDPHSYLVIDCVVQRCLLNIRLSVCDDSERRGNDAFPAGLDLGSCTGDQRRHKWHGAPLRPHSKASIVDWICFEYAQGARQGDSASTDRRPGVDFGRMDSGQLDRVSITGSGLFS